LDSVQAIKFHGTGEEFIGAEPTSHHAARNGASAFVTPTRAIVAHAQATRRPIEAGLAIIRFAANNSKVLDFKNGMA
jgi:hypothetical protein